MWKHVITAEYVNLQNCKRRQGDLILVPSQSPHLQPGWHRLHECHARLGGSLKELLPVVEERLANESDFHRNTYQLSELRFARLCIVGTCSSLGVCGR